MMILEAALAALLSVKKLPPKPVKPDAQSVAANLGGRELATAIKRDLEAIAGPGSVDVSVDHETLFSVRVSVPSVDGEVSVPIFDRELKLYRLFPDYSFDFYLRLRADSAGQKKR